MLNSKKQTLYKNILNLLGTQIAAINLFQCDLDNHEITYDTAKKGTFAAVVALFEREGVQCLFLRRRHVPRVTGKNVKYPCYFSIKRGRLQHLQLQHGLCGG